jgi:hypothetical protein
MHGSAVDCFSQGKQMPDREGISAATKLDSPDPDPDVGDGNVVVSRVWGEEVFFGPGCVQGVPGCCKAEGPVSLRG